ncbi:MAG TPA: replication-associated recombination protein A [Candidatus Sulfotelmatobacter sp.]|jgi:putative ATPase|nr:replication-associated recombination protein A [Candidatus Sulfotelmatobacter sp.]
MDRQTNLAYRMRPQTLDDYAGQEQLVGKDKILRRMIEQGTLSSMIFWGPPGSGKTTLAHLIAQATKVDFHQLSGVTSGKKDLLETVAHAKKTKKKTILFIDEIHRWNKAQQDALLPYVENGTIILIGATTENPSFEIISALLSRCRVFVLKSLETEQLQTIIQKALTDKKDGVGEYQKKINSKAEELLIRLSGGDARIMLNALEIAVTTYQEKQVTPEIIKEIFQTKSAGLYDKKADEHYTIISSYIKSMRASNTDAALYYLARMIEGGEDAKFIARRMVIFASEDIGMAQPTALVVANEVFRAVETIGYPECAINLAHGTVYLAKAKKDRSAVDAYAHAREDVLNFPNEPIPLHLRNAPTNLMKELGYAKGYSWNEGKVGPDKNLSFLPEKLQGRKYYKEKIDEKQK